MGQVMSAPYFAASCLRMVEILICWPAGIFLINASTILGVGISIFALP